MIPLLRATLLAFSSMLAILPNGFTYLASLAPQIRQDIRYATPNNFTGARVPGYDAPACILTTPAAKALLRVERTLLTHYLTLRVYDCYRPESAVDAFVAWSKRPNDLRNAALYYPNLSKSGLFARGYISERSRTAAAARSTSPSTASLWERHTTISIRSRAAMPPCPRKHARIACSSRC
uniref:D-alanyl-D-alanine dipeptidase n=1 Tax=mine drainage metagenome TaxID=410659 RepID=E6PFF2_9ZZZZ